MIKCLCIQLLDPSDHIDKIKKQKRKPKNEYIWIKNVLVWLLNVWLEMSELGWGTLRLGGMRSGTAWWLCFGHQAWRAAWKPHTALKSGSRQPTGLLRSLFPLPCFLHSYLKTARWILQSLNLSFQERQEKILGICTAPRTAAQTRIKFHLHLHFNY